MINPKTPQAHQSGKAHITGIIFLLIILAIFPLILMTTGYNISLDLRSRASTNTKQLSLPILVSEDDADENADISGAVNVVSPTLHLGWYKKAVGLRFQNISLSALKGAVISAPIFK